MATGTVQIFAGNDKAEDTHMEMSIGRIAPLTFPDTPYNYLKVFFVLPNGEAAVMTYYVTQPPESR